ncbi:hypothetical protein Acr_00g0058700 [Actinidia rufa]|uniref:RRM domain-containing protein n=1 Tax=Actinidia rufa TaxID=165716 RepID=A0A7J0DMY6_9ERIC|nr:hypothetical protein Acr_00g0058700 [Actinidia rufa]
MDDLDLSGLPTQLEDMEDDFFGSRGWMELDFEPKESLNIGISDVVPVNGIGHYGLPNGVPTVAGEHPYREHPSRTLFDNPLETDINQGTLVVFNLDASVSNDDLRQIFGAYGEVKEIRETPPKRHHKFIEFYDVRAAEAALKALNRSDIAGKRIKLEPSRPGGSRRKPVEHNPLQGFSRSPGLGNLSPVKTNYMPGVASILPSHVPNPARIAPIVKDQGTISHASQVIGNVKSTQGVGYQQCNTFPEQKLSASPGPMSSFDESNSNSSGIGTLFGPQFLWGNPTPYSIAPVLPGQHLWGTLLHPGTRHFGYFPDSPETSFMNPVAFGGLGLSGKTASYVMNVGAHPAMSVGVALPGNMPESGSPRPRMMPLSRNGSMFFGNSTFQGTGLTGNEGLLECGRTVEVEGWSTVYTSKMLLAAIDEFHRGTCDFLCLQIDFKVILLRKLDTLFCNFHPNETDVLCPLFAE